MMVEKVFWVFWILDDIARMLKLRARDLPPDSCCFSVFGGGGGNGGGNTGYNYDPTTGVITIDTSMIYQTLQNTGGAIALSGSDTFDNRGIIVLRTSNTGVRALSRNCTHAGFTVNINTAANNLVCPSHNSIFDLNGNVVSGPASGALTRYSASLSGSIITITQGS